jgi:hypothetical protein
VLTVDDGYQRLEHRPWVSGNRLCHRFAVSITYRFVDGNLVIVDNLAKVRPGTPVQPKAAAVKPK